MFDLLIVGGGLAGATLACALSKSGLRIALVEASPPDATLEDHRALALNLTTQKILQALDLWKLLSSQAMPIRTVHVTEQGKLGVVRLESCQEGVEALGYVVESAWIHQQIRGLLPGLPHVTLLQPARVENIVVGVGHAKVTLRHKGEREEYDCRLVVGADGDRSTVRQLLQVPTDKSPYQQSALVASLVPEHPHRGVAYERFTPLGAIALLPMSEGCCGLIWSMVQEVSESISALQDADLLQRLQQEFGQRLGRLTGIGPRQVYPLNLIQTKKIVGSHWVLVGNAAHTIHPISAQGFNLGLRDVALLAEMIHKAVLQGEPWGDVSFLARYAQTRQADYQKTIQHTDFLARFFVNPAPWVKLGRSLGLLASSLSPTIKHNIARQGMGLAWSGQSQLSRGVPL